MAKDVLVESVARGSTKKITKSIEFELSPSCTYSYAQGSLSLSSAVKRTYTVETEFKGPDLNSNFNSIEYRIKFYEDNGTFTGYQYTDMGQKLPDVSGSWSSPRSYAEYSFYKNVV